MTAINVGGIESRCAGEWAPKIQTATLHYMLHILQNNALTLDNLTGKSSGSRLGVQFRRRQKLSQMSKEILGSVAVNSSHLSTYHCLVWMVPSSAAREHYSGLQYGMTEAPELKLRRYPSKAEVPKLVGHNSPGRVIRP